MKNKKSLLWIYAVISLVVILSAVIVALTAGINLGTKLGGGTQVSVKITAEMNVDSYANKLENAMKDQKAPAERVFAEDRYVDKYVVAKTASKVKNVEAFKQKLSTKLGVDASDILVESFSSSITKNAVIWTSVAIVCLLLALFVIGWIRYGVVSGASLVIITLHSLIMAISLFVITRLPITTISLIEILALTVLVIFASILLLEKIRENKKLRHNDGLSAREIVSMSKRETMKPLIYLSALLLIVCLVLVCVPVRLVTLSALSLLVCLVAGVYSFYFLGVDLHSQMLSLQEDNQKLALSKNVSASKKSK